MNKVIDYLPKGVCSTFMRIEVDEDDIIQSFKVERGCNGNLKGISKLVVGRKREDIISLLNGIDCNGRGTSCPDQLAQALKTLD